jgi:hypothetical protein
MSKAHLPPVPPANRSPAGGGTTQDKDKLPPDQAKENAESRNRDTEQQGRQGNTWQNTHNQGYQQDR